MKKGEFKDVHTLIAVENPMVRKGLHEAFKHSGFGKVSEAATHEHLQRSLEDSSYDVIVMTPEMNGFFIAPLVAELRNGRLNHHPFAITVMLLGQADHEYVRKVIDCGPDDMLLMPVAPGQLLSRVEVLSRARKPFVVTQDYTGPDRRKQKREGTEQIPLVEVPNPLAARVRQVKPDKLRADIEQAAERLNTLKLDRYAVQLTWLKDVIQGMFRDNTVDPMKLQAFARRIQQVAEDLPARMGLAADGLLPKRVAEIVKEADALLAAGASAGDKLLENIAAGCTSLVQEIRRSVPPQTVSGRK